MNALLHNERVQTYLDSVCEQIRCREVHAEIREELLSHVADRVEALIESGVAESTAIEQALNQMGDPEVVGRQMHQLHRPRLDWWLIGAMAGLVCVGLWAVYAVDISGSWGTPYLGLLQRQLLWTGIGVAIGGVLMLFDYRRLRRLSWPLFGIMLLATLPDRTNMSGWTPYLGLSPLLYVPALAGIFANWDWDARHSIWKAMAVIALPSLLYLQSSSNSLLVDYLVLCGVLLLASRPNRSQLLLLSGVGALGVAMLAYSVISRAYLLARFLTWINPNRDPNASGYHVLQSRMAISHAGLWGQGPLATFDRLPAPHTDFVFPYLVHSLGWLAGAALCVLFLLFAARLLRASRGVKDRYGRFLIHGIAALFLLQSGWNLLMTVGIAPTRPVYLPFVSGGSQQALYMALVGLTLSVFRRKTTTAKI